VKDKRCNYITEQVRATAGQQHKTQRIQQYVIYCCKWQAVVQDVYQTECQDTDNKDNKRDEKLNKESIIAAANAVVHPRTVMIKRLPSKHSSIIK